MGTDSLGHARPRVVVVAVGLWAVVVGLLGYGVTQTVAKAAALFG